MPPAPDLRPHPPTPSRPSRSGGPPAAGREGRRQPVPGELGRSPADTPATPVPEPTSKLGRCATRHHTRPEPVAQVMHTPRPVGVTARQARCRCPPTAGGRPWNDSWDEHRSCRRAMCAFRASTCDICAGETPGAAQQPTFNPLVQGSSPWRRPAAASTSSASSAGVSLSERSRSVPAGWRAAAAAISSTPGRPSSRTASSQVLPG